jgi:predicted RNA-binding protein YlqC (UPF0109 family)
MPSHLLHVLVYGKLSALALRVAKEDIGKIIGKQGRTADALRTLLNAVSFKAKTRSLL